MKAGRIAPGKCMPPLQCAAADRSGASKTPNGCCAQKQRRASYPGTISDCGFDQYAAPHANTCIPAKVGVCSRLIS